MIDRPKNVCLPICTRVVGSRGSWLAPFNSHDGSQIFSDAIGGCGDSHRESARFDFDARARVDSVMPMGDQAVRRGIDLQEEERNVSNDELLDLIAKSLQTIERAKKATVKGMPPLEREPAPVSNDE
jgi:hypothetical protein